MLRPKVTDKSQSVRKGEERKVVQSQPEGSSVRCGCLSMYLTVSSGREGGLDTPDLCQLAFRDAFEPKGLSKGREGEEEPILEELEPWLAQKWYQMVPGSPPCRGTHKKQVFE